jgi:TolB-like protein
LAALRKPLVIVAGVGTVLGGLAGYITMYRTVTGGAPAAAPAATSAPAEQALSLAVLPLANQTGDETRRYLADGLTAAITADLARLPQLLVVPPQAAAGLHKKGLTLAQLGTEARVRFVLEGSVAAEGEKLRIATTLSDTATGRQVWAETFEGRASEMFALQDQVTLRIRAGVAPSMVLTALPEAERRRQDPKAADLILRAQALQLQQRTLTNQKRLVELWRQALALDPDNPVAMSGLAYSTRILVSSFAYDLGMTMADRIAMLQAVEPLAHKVLLGHPASAEMPSVLSDLALYRGEVEMARQVLLDAQQRDPRSFQLTNDLAFFHTRMGEPEAAHEWGLKTLKLPTWRPPFNTFNNLREACMMMRRYDEAVQWARRLVEVNPERPLDHARLAMAGDEAGARAATAEALRRDPNFTWKIDHARWPGREADYRKHVDEVIRVAAARAGVPTRDVGTD